MLETVELPVWVLVLIGLFAVISAAERVMFPSVRWFFRRRAERVVARLNKRLTRPIQPFKLARRHDMIQQILYDPDVIRAVNEHADNEGVPDNVAFETAERYAREIVPAFSATLYFAFGIRLARWLAKSLYRVRMLNRDPEVLNGIDPDATVVFVINHRSNMDYVLVTYLVAPDSALSYAVGEWARVWPLRPLIKMMGGYFIRRGSRNALYRKVLARYVQLSMKNGVTQAIFPEGGLSRNGALGMPKLGLISYILDGFDPSGSADVVFVPVGLNYDRVLEDRVLMADHTKAGARFRFRLSTVFRYIGRHLWQRLTGRFHRLGFAGVSFGDPVSLRSCLDEDGNCRPDSLAARLMDEVGQAVPILPVPLVCYVLEQAGHRITRGDLQQQFESLLQQISPGVSVCLPGAGPENAVAEGLRMLEARGVVDRDGEEIAVTDRYPELIGFYAASIQQYMSDIKLQKP